jgi:hypothetical protein
MEKRTLRLLGAQRLQVIPQTLGLSFKVVAKLPSGLSFEGRGLASRFS